MKNPFLKPIAFIATVTLIFSMSNPAGAANIGFVAGLAGGALDQSFDISWKDRLEGQGHTVTLIDQFTTAANIPVVDMFIISSDVGSGNIRNAANIGLQQPKPYIVYEYGNFGDFFGGGGTQNPAAPSHSITIANPGHPLAAGLTGDVIIYNSGTSKSLSVSNGNRSANATVVGNRTGVTGDAVPLVLEAGQQGGANGTTTFPAMRIGVPCYADWPDGAITEDGWKLLDAAVNYALPATVNFDHLTVSAPETPQLAGSVFSLTITAKDVNDVTVTNPSGTVSMSAVDTLESTRSLMEFDWNGDNVFGDNSGPLDTTGPNPGTKTINARNKKAETAEVKADAGTAITPLPPEVTTTPDAYARLQIVAEGEVAAPGTASGMTTALPKILADGSPSFVKVFAVDQYWNPVNPQPGNNLTITSTDATATLPSPNPRPLDLDPFFNITFNTPGVVTVAASDGVTSFSATSSNIIVNPPAVTWVGDGNLNKWDTTTENWTGPSAYIDGAQVTFDETGSNTPAVDIVGTVSPEKISVLSNQNYTLGSTTGGSIAGAPLGLLKDNSGMLTLTTANTYTGQTNITEGILIIGHVDAVPATSNLRTDTGVVIGLAAGDFTRGSGGGAGQINLNNNSGFAAYGADRTVNIGGASAKLTWGINDFGGSAPAATMIFSESSADGTLILLNPLSLTTTSAGKTFAVRDGSATVDAMLSGALTDGNNAGIIKSEAGTLQLNSPDNAYSGPTSITGGALAMGASNVIPDASDIIIGAATLDAATFTDTVGNLDVTAAATINLGSGGTLAFAASNGVEWTGGTLNITGSFVAGSSLRFGKDTNGLLSSQLLQITLNGEAKPFALTNTGYLTDGSISDPYAAWSEGAPFDGDANNDGVKNGLAWLLGAASPNVNAVVLLPDVSQNGGNLAMTFDCKSGADRGTALLSLQHSSDLGINDMWATVAVPGVIGNSTVDNVNFVVTDPDPAGGHLHVVATIQNSQAAAGGIFGRLKAEK